MKAQDLVRNQALHVDVSETLPKVREEEWEGDFGEPFPGLRDLN